MKWITIPELSIKITRKIHCIGIPIRKLKIPFGFRMPTIDEHLFLCNNPKYSDIFKQSYEYASNNHDEGKIIGVFPGCLAYYADGFVSFCSENGVRFVKSS